MQHKTKSDVTHKLTIPDDEATAIGEWLLDVQNQTIVYPDGHQVAADAHYQGDKGYELAMQLANHLNGVE